LVHYVPYSFEYTMSYNADFYQIPTGIDKTLAKHIKKTIHTIASDREPSQIGGSVGDGSLQGLIMKSERNSLHRWVATDSWISGMMAHFIRQANLNYFRYDLIGWADQVQYTEYNGKGTHYNWHTDSAVSPLIPNTVRKLSISLLLSGPDEYEGGEFQLMFPGNKGVTTIKPELGQAIIFPSFAQHRVRPLKKGNRVSLVGWYGGPMFK